MNVAEPLVPVPGSGRTFSSSRRIRLSDRAPDGRLRLDAVARYLQDIATDDVDETGWGAPEHLWVLRSIRIDVVATPFADDRVDLTTWSSGRASLAAARRMSLQGDRGGRVELDSVWIHLGSDARPARIEGFDVYSTSAGDRTVSTRLELAEPSPRGIRTAWPLRATDVDVLGHVNNAAYWDAVEERLGSTFDARSPFRARLDYRHPLDLGDEVELVESAARGTLALAYRVAGDTKAVAVVTPISTS